MFKYSFLFFALLNSIGYAQMDSLTANQMRKGTTHSSVVNQKGINGGTVEDTYSITITVKNIRNKDGVIRFKFYDDSTPFPHDLGFLKVVVAKTEITGDSLKITLHDFKAQHMAIALLDDENNNVKLDFGWFFPKEGHAFSDYYHASLRRPVYNDFAFYLTGDKNVVMTMRYY